VSALAGRAGRVVSAVAIGAAVGTAIVVLLAALVALAGYDAGRALTAIWSGSLGSVQAIGSATLVRATPLILTGLAVSLAFRAGVLNIGAEGQLLAGAAASTAVAAAFVHGGLGAIALPAALIAGALGGGLWAALPALLRLRYGVLEVISTIMMNFVALYAVGYLVRGPLQEPTRIYPQSESLPDVVRLGMLVPGTRLHWGFALAIAAAGVLWFVLGHTAAGFRLRASGANPTAARSAGLIDVGRTTTHAFLASGALAGLAGAVEVTGVTYALYENISPGYGYTAIAVALLGGLQPLAVAASAMFFGALEAGAGAMQRDAGIPSVLVSVVEALTILAILGVRRLNDVRVGRRSVGSAVVPGSAP